VQIPGAMPRLNAIPQGCAFNPRCERAFDRCRIDRPDPIDRGGDRRQVACWLYDEVDAAGKEKANV
jgi:peptide/nickel transport system ATP-binding protein